MRLEGAHWDSAVLHALGARTVADVVDVNGLTIAFDVEPEIDISQYPAAEETASREQLAAYAAARRFAIETGGLEVEGQSVATDRESQGLIAGAYALAAADPEAVFSFKALGGFVSLDADAMKAIGLAVARHVQAAFAREGAVLAEIEAGTITTPAAVDATFAGL